jgi:glycosyltransferase involved in cell wall biosynthesis
MRILFLLTQDLESPSGLGRYWPLARELVRLGHTVNIAALHSNYTNLVQKQFEQDGVKIHYVAPMHVRKEGSTKVYYSSLKLLALALWATWRLTLAALHTPADIIHVGKPQPMNSLAGQVAHLLKRSRRLYMDCDDDETQSNRFSAKWQQSIVGFFERHAPHWAQLVTTNTHVTRHRLIANGISTGRIIYLPNGVVRERFQAPSRTELAALRAGMHLENNPVVIYAGSLSLPSHPVDILLEAFQQVHQAMPSTRLVIVGGGEDIETLHHQATALDLSDVVRFTGRIPPAQIGLYYHLAQVSVDPVYDDAAGRARAPLKMFESWACGIPFVSSDVGDRRILAGSPPAALLIRTSSPGALAEAILQILYDPSEGAILRKLGLQRVEAYYWDQIANQVAWIYEKA